jgi:hypothetical protein
MCGTTRCAYCRERSRALCAELPQVAPGDIGAARRKNPECQHRIYFFHRPTMTIRSADMTISPPALFWVGLNWLAPT